MYRAQLQTRGSAAFLSTTSALSRTKVQQKYFASLHNRKHVDSLGRYGLHRSSNIHRPSLISLSIDRPSCARPFTSDTPNIPPATQTPRDDIPIIAQEKKDAIFELVDKLYANEDELAVLLEELDLLPQFESLVYSENLDLADTLKFIVGYRNEQHLLADISRVRQVFGDYPPVQWMTDEAIKAFTRLYGPPLPYPKEENELVDLLEGDEVSEAGNAEEALSEAVEEGEVAEEDELDLDAETAEALEERMQEVARALGGEIIGSELQEDYDQDEGNDEPDTREPLHELTEHGKYRIGSSTTLTLPEETMVAGIRKLLYDYPNVHLREAATETFGGSQLPNSLRVPRDRSRAKPLPISASQHYMDEMQGNMFLAVLFPGLYATSLSILSEVRKRAGSDWLSNLIKKEGGPSFLDAGAGGAAAIAWQDLLKSQMSQMDESSKAEQLNPGKTTCGKTTVLAGSDALRHRASKLLEDTTFIPRLPDYIHVRGGPTLEDAREPQQHKTYDVIVASHALWPLQNEQARRDYVQNLWSMLNPDGGILILVEKGIQRGYECVAGARQLILDRLIASPGSSEYEKKIPGGDGETVTIQKEKGMLLAPDTHHQRCPMYPKDGQSAGRRDYISFMQRYHRPSYLNNILMDEKSHNHEDVQFSYVAVQRGVDLRETQNIQQDEDATTLAFAGFENREKQAANMEASSKRYGGTPALHLVTDTANPLALPRIIYPPLKRTGHIILDVSTPSGTIERWTVAKKWSRLAYRAARKAQWGDLWALGAKTRQSRQLKLGTDAKQSKEEKRSRRRELREMIKESKEDGEDEVARRLEANSIFIPEFDKVMSKYNSQIRVTKKKIIKDRKRENRMAKKAASAGEK